MDGMCIDVLEKRKSRSDNTSGFRGMSKCKNGKYRVHIGFKRQRYYVGIFENLTDAVIARLNVEHLIHDNFEI